MQGSNLGLPHCRQILYHLSHQGICKYGGNKVGREMGPHSYMVTHGEDWDSHCLYLEAVSCFSGSLISFPLIRFPPNPKFLVGFCPWVLSESLEGSPSGKTIALWFLGTRSKVILEQKYKPGSFLSQNRRPFAERSPWWVIPSVGSVLSILRVIFAITPVTSLLPKAIFLTFSKLCSKPSIFWTHECWFCWQDPKSPPWSTQGFSYTSQHEPCSC